MPEFSASAIFRNIADAVPAYEGLRYPALKDESDPVKAKHALAKKTSVAENIDALKAEIEAVQPSHRITAAPRIGHKLHRLTTMTSKTPQFHLLAHGNPKPENLLVSPLVQFDLDGNPREQAAVVGAGDRSNPSGR
ncbi:MAG: hypothetical protein IPM59_06465 [Chloracidobacterium sp.]|nr:hypothetical protein [Chloracidobacterium sp.]